jgi:hypothetical protein
MDINLIVRSIGKRCELDSHGGVQYSKPGSCEHDNKRPLSITGWLFIEHLSDTYLSMKERARWSYLVAVIFNVRSLRNH